MKLNCIWTALPWSELCYFTHWVGKHSWGTNKPYLQAPLSALLSGKVRSIQGEEISRYPATQDTSVFLSTQCENTDFAKKRAIHHTLRLQMTSAKAAGQQQQPQASVWTSNCCECNMSSVPKIETQCCLRKHRGNQYVRALKSSPQPSATKWKYMEKKPLEHLLTTCWAGRAWAWQEPAFQHTARRQLSAPSSESLY